ncbi:MAG TPA: flagellar protein FliS, partial [Planctomycetota bacterium]|nr:flagellar protein FliS [Planctomycetota bacterium]
MSRPDPAAAYREAALEHAPPIEIVRKLYAGALRFLDRAQRLDPRAEALAFNDAVARVDAIVCELRLSLDPAAAPEATTVVRDLTALYLFVEQSLGRALGERSHAPLVD